MPAEECSLEARIELARLDERIKGLQREIEHAERGHAHALQLASDELARRLELLNHAHQRAVEVQATYLPRELFTKEVETIRTRLHAIEGDAREQRGRMWLPMLAIAALVTAATVALSKLLFP